MTEHPEQHQPDRTDIEYTQRLLGERYQLSWIVGRGGMSTVWLARDTVAQRDVAIKILKPEYTESPEFRERFRNEAEAAEHFDSPNVVATYDYGEISADDSQPTNETRAVFCYIVMEYVRGESLADVLRRERQLPEPLALDLIRQTAMGLAAIHATGTVHRDIKPANLLLTADGTVKITDFGIAKAAQAVPLTQTGMVVGTAQYVSPEQAQGREVTAASDVYSLGVVAYEVLAGHRPFRGDSSVSVAIKHISEQPEPLPEELSAPLRELVNTCLRKSPRARYADGQELAEATAAVLSGAPAPRPAALSAADAAAHTDVFAAHGGARGAAPEDSDAELSQVVSGPGTAVPPRQGPAQGPRKASAAGAAGAASSRSAGRRGGQRGSATPWIVLGVVVALGLGVIGYLLLSDSNSSTQEQETKTVTSEVTTSPTQEEYVPQQPVDPRPEKTQPSEDNGSDDGETSSTRPERPRQSSTRPGRPTGTQPTPSSPRQPSQPSQPTAPTEDNPVPPAPDPGGEQPNPGNNAEGPTGTGTSNPADGEVGALGLRAI
ncbi:protein kinase [Corynebacterium sp. UMB9976]|uniref:serine/threonine-protein kinase n=1 Tax=unclassified Corynebacterium TaxID=2624378 RepID=UPI002550F571|nr:MULTISPECIES: serine/threonine-protein kinase [unclassified Corynebacterium]MDK6302645.1 protein kinase [Corynebacterium sp. UMB9976]MDK7135577.1 protein kinase [Corynebacterium sp. UMB4614]